MSSYHKNKILPSYFSSLWKSIQGNDSSCGMTTAFNMSSSITSISLAKKQKNYTFHYVILSQTHAKNKKNYTIHFVILSQTLAKNQKITRFIMSSYRKHTRVKI